MLDHLRNYSLLITAGGTRESIDPVRFIGNRSSGRMGCSIADAALRSGLKPVLIYGEMDIAPPQGNYTRIHAESTLKMKQAVHSCWKKKTILIMSAAVADYIPAKYEKQKIKKKSDTLILHLKKAPDILSSLSMKKDAYKIGFAAETSALHKHSLQKLKAKNLDMIIGNRVGLFKTGMGSDYNELLILQPDGSKEYTGKKTKKSLGLLILKRIDKMISCRETL